MRHVMLHKLPTAGALLGADNQPLEDTWEGRGSVVVKPATGSRLRADAEIEMTLFRATEVGAPDDLHAIARAVFHSDDSAVLARLRRILESLTKSGRVATESGIRPAPGAAQVLRA
jgi:hypothetical protein